MGNGKIGCKISYSAPGITEEEREYIKQAFRDILDIKRGVTIYGSCHTVSITAEIDPENIEPLGEKIGEKYPYGELLVNLFKSEAINKEDLNRFPKGMTELNCRYSIHNIQGG